MKAPTVLVVEDNPITAKMVRIALEVEGYAVSIAEDGRSALVDFHRTQGKLATVTTAQPPGRYGALDLEGAAVRSFYEKPVGDGGWINGGFFVLEPAIFDYIEDDDTIWEHKPLERLAHEDQFRAFEAFGELGGEDTEEER